MIIQKIEWGLGNQMFQYSFIKALSLRNKIDFKIDVSKYKTYFRAYELELFNIEKVYAERKDIPWYENLYSKNKYINFFLWKIRLITRALNKKHFVEKNLTFNLDFFNISLGYIEWYFQTEKYFKDFETVIRNDFTFTLPLSEKSLQIKGKIENLNSVSVHIRRWDYLKWNNHQTHWLCWIDYYKKAITYLEEIYTDLTFFFFSDDIERVKQNIPLENAYYIDWNSGNNSRQDMQLMSLCKHNIIANSSFSRRWAWLNKNSHKIVITPKIWFANKNLDATDIIPENWLKL